MKIYLDWNCITHLKDKEHSEIRECIMNLKNFCVFPFSDAHFSDLMRSYKEDGSNAYFDYDLELLESVCETNLMLFIKEQDMPMPYIASPKEYFRKSAIDDFKNVELLKDGGFSELVDSLCSDFPWLSKPFVSLLSVKPINIPGNPIIPRFTNVLEATDFTLKAFYNQKDLNRKISHLSYKGLEQAKDKITVANSGNIENQINKFLKLFGCENIDELLNKTQTQKDTLSVFIQKYLFYDMCGFRSDRNRTMENISTDAKHAFYGSYCDVYVTMDAKSREKTEAIYKSTGIKTNVVDFKDFISYMENHIRRLVNISNYYDDCCNNLPGNYLDNVEDLKVRPCYFDNPLFGFFNIGYPIIHNHKEHVVFKRILKGRSIVFYSEIDCFINLFKVVTDADFIQILEEYKTCLKNGNGDSKPFVIIYENYTMVFGTDYEDARLPMIIVSKSK